MINHVETIGLVVEASQPPKNKVNVDVNTDIKIKFNAEILPNTILGNIAIYEDSEGVFNGDIADVTLTRINGKISHESKTLIFTPNSPLKENKKHIIHIRKEGIKDIIGRYLAMDYVSVFYTDNKATIKGVSVISPTFGDILEENPIIEFLNTSSVYNVQISKNIEFDTFVVDDVVNSINSESIKYSLKTTLEDGLYFVRVKGEDTSYSETVQFYVKRNNGLVSEEDYDELLKEFEEDEFEVLETFPYEDKMSGVGIGTMYMKFNGKLDFNDLNINKTHIYGNLFDETDEDTIEQDGYVNNKVFVVYDKEENVSYVINKI